MNLDVNIIKNELIKYNNIPSTRNNRDLKVYFTEPVCEDKPEKSIYDKNLRKQKIDLILAEYDNCDINYKNKIKEEMDKIIKKGYIAEGELNVMKVEVQESTLTESVFEMNIDYEMMNSDKNLNGLIAHKFLSMAHEKIFNLIKDDIQFINEINEKDYFYKKMEFIQRNRRISKISIPFHEHIHAFSVDHLKKLYFGVHDVFIITNTSYYPTVKIYYNLELLKGDYMFFDSKLDLK